MSRGILGLECAELGGAGGCFRTAEQEGGGQVVGGGQPWDLDAPHSLSREAETAPRS